MPRPGCRRIASGRGPRRRRARVQTPDYVADAGLRGSADPATRRRPARAAKPPRPRLEPVRRAWTARDALYTVDWAPGPDTPARRRGDARSRARRRARFDPRRRGDVRRPAAWASGGSSSTSPWSTRKGRVQFGQPIGAFQAVKHHLANALTKLEFARPADILGRHGRCQDPERTTPDPARRPRAKALALAMPRTSASARRCRHTARSPTRTSTTLTCG